MAEPTEPQAIAWHRDVLALIPPTEDIVQLESLVCLADASNPLMRLALWRPADDVDEFIREFLLGFGEDLLAAMWKSPDLPSGRDDPAHIRLKQIAFKDEVSGLYNRRFFSIRLEEEVSRYRRLGHPVSVVLVDVDDFGAVNDDLGHSAGEQTLEGMAEILLRHTRGVNVVCRYDDGLFAVLLVDTSKAGARLYVDRIDWALSSWDFAHRPRMTASFGIASLPDDTTSSSTELMRAAAEILLAAKRAGRKRTRRHRTPEPPRE